MHYVNFGSTGLKVSRLALGLGLRGQGDETAAQRLIEHAIDQGINLIDCANLYGPMNNRASIGRSEVVLGRAIRGKRDQVVITSKVASPVGPGPNDRGLSRYHILREIEGTLRRLGTDHVDVYLAHHFDPTTPLEETVRAFDEIVRSGKARYVGCCNFAAWQVCRTLWIADKGGQAPFMCVQNSYSLLNRRLEQEMFGLVRDRGLGLMAYSPLAVGLLSGAYQPDHPAPTGSLWASFGQDRYAALMAGAAGEVVRTVQTIAAEEGRTPAQVAVAWVLSQPEVTCAISGADTIAHFDDVRPALHWHLPPDQRKRLDAVSQDVNTVLD
jgi:1-deoxyxylulose-5-phosphate synthase